ncbi:uncharacterized protein ISCGN_021417 [Ixodes scapularis]
MIRKKRGITVCPEWETDRNGRVCSVEVLYHGELHKFVSVYAPNEAADRTDFFKNLRQHVDTPCKTVLAGDFNCVLSERDCSKRLRSDASRVELRKILRDFDLVDAMKYASTEDPAYTHWQGDCHARLDRVYLSGDLPTASSVLEVWPVAFSDHALVTVTLGRPGPRVQKSSWWSGWKLNESLLEDEPLRVQIKELIESRSKGMVMDAVIWEELKEEIKLAAFRYSQERATKAKTEKRFLTQTLRTLIAEENRTPGVFTQDIRECKGRILELLEKEYRGAMIRSRTLFLEKDEEPQKIFKTKERLHATRNRIEKLQVGENELTQQNKIEDAFLHAYTNLFTGVEENQVHPRSEGALPKISEAVRKQMNRKITISEVKKAIKDLTPRKSPGIDELVAPSTRRLGGKHQPIKARSLLFAAHGKCFQGLGGEQKPIKAGSLLFAAHGKCFQDTPCKTVLADDFNCVLSERDCSKPLRSDASRVELRKILRYFDLVDAKEYASTEDPAYTHWQGDCHARLDRVYLSGNLPTASSVLEVWPVAFSDHALVTVTMGRPGPRVQKSSWWSGWKLNESLLEDEALRVQIKELIESRSKGMVMDAVIWEELKEEIKLTAFRYSPERATRAKTAKRFLTQTLRTLIAEENRTPGVFTQDIRECKGRILELLEKEYGGAIIRSRKLFLEKDEEPQKIFKTKERLHATRNRIKKLQVGENELTQQNEIEDALLHAYTNLLTGVEENQVHPRSEEALPKISEAVRKHMNRKITTSEVKKAIKDLTPRKSPGIDGLGSSFYKAYVELLSPILGGVFSDTLKRGLLPPSMRQAVTVLIPKKKAEGTPEVTTKMYKNHQMGKLKILNADGDRWKNMRSLLTPAFSSSNVKKISSVMDACTNDVMEVLASLSDQDKAFEIGEVYRRLSLDVMLRSAFGVESNVQKNQGIAGVNEILELIADHEDKSFTGWLPFLFRLVPLNIH